MSIVRLGKDPENRDNDPVLKTFEVDEPVARQFIRVLRSCFKGIAS